MAEDDDYVHHDPVERFGQLPETTRKWLESLRPEDIKALNDTVRMKESVESAGHFLKWLSIFIVAIFVGMAQLSDAIQKLWVWLSHPGKS